MKIATHSKWKERQDLFLIKLHGWKWSELSLECNLGCNYFNKNLRCTDRPGFHIRLLTSFTEMVLFPSRIWHLPTILKASSETCAQLLWSDLFGQEEEERHHTHQSRWPEGCYQSNQGFPYTWAVHQAHHPMPPRNDAILHAKGSTMCIEMNMLFRSLSFLFIISFFINLM